jgi:hypothetical protein
MLNNKKGDTFKYRLFVNRNNLPTETEFGAIRLRIAGLIPFNRNIHQTHIEVATGEIFVLSKAFAGDAGHRAG